MLFAEAMNTIANPKPNTFSAGLFKAEVSFDCRVTIELRSHGGLQIELTPNVAGDDGKSIRERVEAELKRCGVQDATVLIEDAGALPFVMAARIEAAARRAGFKVEPPARGIIGRRAESPRDRLRRSRLYVPGSQPKYFANAVQHRPDAVILDLEDAVHPAEKDSARILVRNALAQLSFAECERMVRINPFPMGIDDLRDVVLAQPDVILIPKAETAEQIIAVQHAISEIQNGIDSNWTIWLMPIIETALGIENAFLIASATRNVCAIAIGLEDYTADLGVAKTEAGTESFYARSRMVNAARAAHVQASDSAFGDIGDMDPLRRWAVASRAMGFDGIGCVHPRQVEVVHAAFEPSQEEIEKALKIVQAFQKAKAKGVGVVALGSKMIDQPVVLRAQKMIDQAKKSGTLPADAEKRMEE
jgi:citrate lyase subunit beta/citryl-CoA lyase